MVDAATVVVTVEAIYWVLQRKKQIPGTKSLCTASLQSLPPNLEFLCNLVRVSKSN
jgi:hypothetical protein